jgi:hypothetical protein
LPASGRRKTPKGGDVNFPLWKRGIEGDRGGFYGDSLNFFGF